MVKSSHQEQGVTTLSERKEIRTTIILPDGKYIVIHHPQTNIAQYSALAQEVNFSDEKVYFKW